MGAHVDLLRLIRGEPVPGAAAPAAQRAYAATAPGGEGDQGQGPVAEVRRFVRARCILDARVWSFRRELWAAYVAWSGARPLCASRDDLEAPLLGAKVAAIGLDGEIIAGVGLRAHWPTEAAEADARRTTS